MKRYELTKEQWNRIKPLLPPEKTGKRGRLRKDDRTMLNGMLWLVRSGAQWRELPEAYVPWQSVYARFAKWRDDGTLETIFHALSADADMENLSVDSTCVKVHESANGGKKTADKGASQILCKRKKCEQIENIGKGVGNYCPLYHLIITAMEPSVKTGQAQSGIRSVK